MNVLVTSARMPSALDEIRKFGRRGHRVFAADTMATAPGAHSRYVVATARVAAPQYLPERFVADIEGLVRAYAIDLIVPCFEEVFYLARHRSDLSAPLFAPSFELLALLHNKATFAALARELGLRTPSTIEVDSREALELAIHSYARYLARPVYSRGGVKVVTNAGPLAGVVGLDECEPTADQPWIVQEFIDGAELCSFSVAQHGRVVAHCTYFHPLEIDHRGGIVFESIVEGETLQVVQRIVEATGYHGQLGLDFRRNSHGLVALECNARPTAGVHLVADRLLVDAVTQPPNGAPLVVPAGVRKKYSSAILRDMLLRFSHLQSDLGYLLAGTIEDVYNAPDDHLPALYQVLSYAHVLGYRWHHLRHHHGTSMMSAYFDGIAWNGEAIP